MSKLHPALVRVRNTSMPPARSNGRRDSTKEETDLNGDRTATLTTAQQMQLRSLPAALQGLDLKEKLRHIKIEEPQLLQEGEALKSSGEGPQLHLLRLTETKKEEKIAVEAVEKDEAPEMPAEGAMSRALAGQGGFYSQGHSTRLSRPDVPPVRATVLRAKSSVAYRW